MVTLFHHPSPRQVREPVIRLDLVRATRGDTRHGHLSRLSRLRRWLLEPDVPTGSLVANLRHQQAREALAQMAATGSRWRMVCERGVYKGIEPLNLSASAEAGIIQWKPRDRSADSAQHADERTAVRR